jgi:trans-aconitate methyltransferase
MLADFTDSKKIQKYWKDRAALQGKKTVGFANQPMDIQAKDYQTRFGFIMPHLPRNKRILDYGCGVGHYSKHFDPEDYIGVDITEALLDIAKKENPEHKYQLVDIVDNMPTIQNVSGIEMLFTTTVLQHNPDYIVENVLATMQSIMAEEVTIALYEATAKKGSSIGHMTLRTESEYERLVRKYFNIDSVTTRSHYFHAGTHSLMVFTGTNKSKNKRH